MNGTSRWRRWAVTLARHAACVMPGARAPWAAAMRRELDYIGDDAAALRWALGCVVASYRARLTPRPDARAQRFGARAAWRVAASGGVILVIGLALHDNADGRTQPPRPALDQTTCEPSQRDAVANLPQQDLRNQDFQKTHERARLDRPAGPDARPIVPDNCKSPDSLRANEQVH
jgi:hypothetical protein